MNIRDLETKFTARLKQAAQESIDLGYHPVRFLEMLKEFGNDGPRLARKLVVSGDIQDGLKHAVKIDRTDLAVESIMLEPEFKALFRSDVLQCAAFRLDRAKVIVKGS